jgi:NAD(P)-dependent dehydrogenase (short-subunit alcohol dehydrogenase family)
LSIKDKVIIVTGAASGIGQATAELFAKQEASLILIDRDQVKLQDLVQKLNRQTNKVVSYCLDVSQSNEVSHMVQACKAAFERIDVLVHAAGICKPAALLDMSDEQWHETLSINLTGAFFLTREVGKLMAAQKSGTMILLTSDRGLYGSADYAHYAASKGGMIALVKSLALYLGKYKVTVNGLNPGMTDTPLARGANPDKWDAKLALDVLGQATSAGEAAQTLLYLSGPASQYTTGQIIGTRLRYGQ